MCLGQSPSCEQTICGIARRSLLRFSPRNAQKSPASFGSAGLFPQTSGDHLACITQVRRDCARVPHRLRGRQEVSESRRWPPSTSPVPIFTASGTTQSNQATAQRQRLIPDNSLVGPSAVHRSHAALSLTRAEANPLRPERPARAKADLAIADRCTGAEADPTVGTRAEAHTPIPIRSSAVGHPARQSPARI